MRHNIYARMSCYGNCIYSACGRCSELVIGIVSNGKMPDLNAFHRKQIVVAGHPMGHPISEILK